MLKEAIERLKEKLAEEEASEFKTCRTCDDEARCKRLQICGWHE